MGEPEEDADTYPALMKRIEDQESEIVKLCFDYTEKNSLFTWANVFGWAVCGRAAALSCGFRSMVKDKNALCALPIVRMQLDNVLRLYAGFFSNDPQTFCQRVRAGERIDRMKSHDNFKMTDKWLVQRLTTRNPWVERVYVTTSGYIHLSGKHMSHIIRNVENGKANLVIGPTDRDRALEEFLDPLLCMRHLNDIIAHAIDDWFARIVITHPLRFGGMSGSLVGWIATRCSS